MLNTRSGSLCHMQTAMAQISLRIRAVWSVPFLLVDIFYNIHYVRGQRTSWSDCAIAHA